MTAPAIETELKFRLGPGAVVRLSGHPALQGEQTTDHLRSVYFDTPDGVLRAAGYGLRVRATGQGFVQTLKRQTAPGQTARDEWETPVASEALDFAALKATPARQLLKGRRRDLSPRFATTVVRRVRMVRLDGALIEAAFDAGDLSAGDRREPIYELELELKEGDPAALFTLARRLARDLAIVPVFESKAERGWRLADGASRSPRRAVPTPLSPDAATGDAFRRLAMACLAQVSANAELLRVVRRPEAMHQLRVGLRRLRAALAVFQPLLAEADRERIEAELKWLAHETDAARDLDVFIRDVFHPTALEAPSPDLAPLGRRLLTARGQAYDRALAAVQSSRYGLLMLETTAWIETAALPDAPVRGFAAEALDRLHRQVEKRGRDLAGSGRRQPPPPAHPRQAPALRRRVLRRPVSRPPPPRPLPQGAGAGAGRARRPQRSGRGARPHSGRGPSGRPRRRLRRRPRHRPARARRGRPAGRGGQGDAALPRRRALLEPARETSETVVVRLCSRALK